MELENGAGASIPWGRYGPGEARKKMSRSSSPPRAPGPWVFHCHILYHMDAGMFRVFDVVEAGEASRDEAFAR